ncbi:LCP family protein [Streptococcus pneumoniae]
MPKKSDRLNHHESLRLQYLYQNFHYLNEKEMQEYEYLRKKEQGNVFKQVHQEEVATDFGYTDLGLPKYSREHDHIMSFKARKRQSPKKRKFKRIVKWVALAFIFILCGMMFMFVKGLMGGHGNQKAAQTEVFHGENTADGVNILILGTDGRIGESSTDTRTDSIMVLNVGGKDKKMKLVSFMRDTLVHIDGVSQGDEYDQKLNVAYSIGEQDNQQGAELVREMLKDNFDLRIKYYALVDFSTFATAIDTLFPNGVEMNASFSTVDGQEVDEVEVPDDLNMKDGIVPNQTIRVGKQRMDGRTLLNYARFRKDDEGDFGRTRRQQEVMVAIFSQVKDPTKLFTGSEAAGKVFALTSTNIPYSFLLTNGLGVIGDAKNGIEKVTVPENGDWEDAYDMYGGQALLIDFEAYKKKLAQLGLR